jgi:hypothetical protein
MATAFLACTLWASDIDTAYSRINSVAAVNSERFRFVTANGGKFECVPTGRETGAIPAIDALGDTDLRIVHEKQFLLFYVFEDDASAVSFRLTFGDEPHETVSIWKGLVVEWIKAQKRTKFH